MSDMYSGIPSDRVGRCFDLRIQTRTCNNRVELNRCGRKAMEKEKMRITVIIPARYESTRFFGKPLADILGKPMIYHVYKQCLKVRGIEEVIVATEDQRIRKAVEDFGGRAIMTSDRHRTGTDRIAEAAQGVDTDIIVNVQGDEPLVHPRMIEQCIEPILAEGVQVTTLMTKIQNAAEFIDTNVVKVVKDKKGFALFLSRSPIPYPKTREGYIVYRQIGLYVFRRDFLLQFAVMEQSPLEVIEGIEFLRILENGYKVRAVETDYRSYNVDSVSDLIEVTKIMQLERQNDKKI